MKDIVTGKELTSRENKIIEEIAEETGLLQETARILYTRGLTEKESVREFLDPGKHRLHDPFLLSGMREAVERIAEAREAGETVLIFGDYDADGISAASILYKAFTEYGLDAYAVVPERENGYGLNSEIVERYAEEIYMGLIVTVDCGISDAEKVKFITEELGIDVIVTDHHEIPETLPDCIVVNPKLPGQAYPFDGLCGAGVAFKLACALLGKKAEKFIDIAALATVADSMSLTGENRSIVHEGLKKLRTDPRPAYRNLLSVAGGKEITAQTLAFTLAPRINAAGRMGDAASALRLFLSDDENEIYDLSVRLHAYNIERQAECDKLYKLAKDKLNEEGAYGNIIMLRGDDWRTGFTGIVAARLAEEYSRPVIMFAGVNGYYKGSARSLPEINIFEAIVACKDLLMEFGGHSQAAGVAVSAENFDAFYKAADEYLGAHCPPEAFRPKIYVDGRCEKPISLRFAEELELLEPCGVGNRRPLFAAKAGALNAAPLKEGSLHVSFSLPACDMLYFGGVRVLDELNLPMEKYVVFEPSVSVFNKQKRLRGIVREVLFGYGRFEGMEDEIFLKQLSSLDTEEREYEKTDTAGVTALAEKAIGNRYGTAFIISDPANEEKFPCLAGIQRCLFRPSENNLFNVVIVGGGVPLEGFDRVIYMDTPPCVTATGRKTVVNTELSGRGVFGDLSVDRAAFKEVFTVLRAMTGRKFTKAVDFYRENRVQCNRKQFLFALKVFGELGIFVCRNGVFTQDLSIKSELKNSALYRRMVRLLGDD